jgi:ribosomal protein L24
MEYPGEFANGDRVVICYGKHCGYQGVITRVLGSFLWVQGADRRVVNVKKRSVALIVEGASDASTDSMIVAGPNAPNFIPNYDSDIPFYDSDITM